MKPRDEAFARPAEISAEALRTSAKLELQGGQITFAVEVTYNPNRYRHMVTGGRITSGTCGAPWDITGGTIGDQLRLDAKRAGQDSCAGTITIVGEYRNPPGVPGYVRLRGHDLLVQAHGQVRVLTRSPQVRAADTAGCPPPVPSATRGAAPRSLPVRPDRDGGRLNRRSATVP
ncbi:hypothetical protein ACFYRC_26860 [Streptomyces sp. NPDC005279]|uniref:hypothetical protein n=1 Tax=Streptomyces sp. NPDC005279 TaxID=3364712 RepID=UPI00368E45C0